MHRTLGMSMSREAVDEVIRSLFGRAILVTCSRLKDSSRGVPRALEGEGPHSASNPAPSCAMRASATFAARAASVHCFRFGVASAAGAFGVGGGPPPAWAAARFLSRPTSARPGGAICRQRGRNQRRGACASRRRHVRGRDGAGDGEDGY